MRKAIALAGLVVAMGSMAATAAPASASSVRPNLSTTEYIRTYWNYTGAPDAYTACNQQGEYDTSSGNPYYYTCDPTERQVANGTWQTGWALYESFLVG